MESQIRKIEDYQVESRPQKGSLRTGTLRFLDYVGLGCQTSHKDHPFFFLFADVDTKEEEVLRLTQQVFARHRLSFYWYETSKGWHVISPCLMEMSQWDLARRDLAQVLDNFYRNLVIRVEWKVGDSKDLHWDNFNADQRYKESQNFHNLMMKRFNLRVRSPNRVPSTLFFTHYHQLRVIE